MGIFRNSAVYAASIALIISGFSFSAKAQTYRDKIEENPEEPEESIIIMNMLLPP